MTTPDDRIARHLRDAAGPPAAYSADVADAVAGRAAAHEAARRRNRLVLAAAALLVVVLGAGALLALNDGDDRTRVITPPPPAETTVPTTPTTSSVPTTGTTPTTSGPARPSLGDWDGERWDFGEITDLAQRAGVSWEMAFDRKQLQMDDGSYQEGKEFTEEPVRAGYITDEQTQNETTRTRTYHVAAGAEVLVWANRDEVCEWTQEGDPPPVRWRTTTVADLARTREYRNFPWTALTFGPAGAVTRIRLSTGC